MAKLLIAVMSSILCLLLAAPSLDVLVEISWHDQQRILQIAMICLVCTFHIATMNRPAMLPGMSAFYLFLTLLISLFAAASLVYALSSVWAFTECAVWVGLLGVLLVSARFFVEFPARLRLLNVVAALVAAVLSVKFIASLLSAFLTREALHAIALLDGFNNIRWFGQLQTLSLPLLAGLSVSLGRPMWRAAIAALLVVWWFTVFVGESRGTVLALLSIMVLMAFTGSAGKAMLKTLILSGAGGFFAYGVLFILLAPALGMIDSGREMSEMMGSSSGRVALWEHAIAQIAQRPWFGWGGMAFAGELLIKEGHPHNLFLQLGYEWGVPVMLGVTALLGHAVFVMVMELRKGKLAAVQQSAIYAFLAMLSHSLVSGVIAMPYAQSWLAVLAGAVWSIVGNASRPRERRLPGSAVLPLLFTVASLWLIFVAARDYQRLVDFEYRTGFGADGPRFWLQGGILWEEQSGQGEADAGSTLSTDPLNTSGQP